MATRTLAQLKAWFKRGAYPIAEHFADWLDSFFHKEEKIPIDSVEGLDERINAKYDGSDGEELDRLYGELDQKVEENKNRLVNLEQKVNEAIGTPTAANLGQGSLSTGWYSRSNRMLFLTLHVSADSATNSIMIMNLPGTIFYNLNRDLLSTPVFAGMLSDGTPLWVTSCEVAIGLGFESRTMLTIQLSANFDQSNPGYLQFALPLRAPYESIELNEILNSQQIVGGVSGVNP
jgi:hypothetical protein